MTSLASSVSEKPIFSPEELSRIDLLRVPEHVAIIMDGNRRWASKRGLPAIAGHWEGAEALTHIVTSAKELGIKTLTVFAFSTENWLRDKKEVDELLELFRIYLDRQRPIMEKKGVRLDTIGDLSLFPVEVQAALEKSKQATKQCKEIELVLALNYGGRDEICRALTQIVKDCEEKKISKKEITEEVISQYLDTAKWKDPDLVLRTSGESRLSNFLLWQLCYAEMIVSEVLWPDFSEKDLLQAVSLYQLRERRWGRS